MIQYDFQMSRLYHKKFSEEFLIKLDFLILLGGGYSNYGGYGGYPYGGYGGKKLLKI